MYDFSFKRPNFFWKIIFLWGVYFYTLFNNIAHPWYGK